MKEGDRVMLRWDVQREEGLKPKVGRVRKVNPSCVVVEWPFSGLEVRRVDKLVVKK